MMAASLTSLTSVLCVLALVLLPTHGMCPAQCQCNNKTVRCEGEPRTTVFIRNISSGIDSVLYLQFN